MADGWVIIGWVQHNSPTEPSIYMLSLFQFCYSAFGKLSLQAGLSPVLHVGMNLQITIDLSGRERNKVRLPVSAQVLLA